MDLGRLVDQALEDIRHQRARAELGLELQRHMLPAGLPDFPGLRVGAGTGGGTAGVEIIQLTRN
ncbi:hypothetical protein [Streptomyces sp. NPDC001274]